MAGDVYTPLEMIRKLISFDTTSRESNLALIHFIRDYLKSHGVESLLIHDETGDKANLYATVGPGDVPGIALSGHTDVVPVDGQPWDTDPFTVVEKGGRLYGRGTSDMKSFTAIALALVPEFQKTQLKTPIHFALSYDEEVGCLGAPKMIERVAALPVQPKVVIVGEPTNMGVVNAHKGVYGFATSVHGLEAHSSATHRGVNAVAYAAECIQFLSGIARELRELRAEPDSGFDPPFTTVHVGTIRGGTAQNIVPLECKFTWEVRLMPGADAEEVPARFARYVTETLLPEMRVVHEGADIVTEAKPPVPGLVPEDGSPAEALVMALARRNRTEVVAYGTEAGQFQEAGMPTVVCGPGSIQQAHRPNEFIELSQIAECEAFMRRLLSEVCAA